MESKTFTALAEPNRLKIVELLRTRSYSVNQVASLLQLRQPQASKHLHVLAASGIVSSRPLAQQRIYTLNEEPFKNLEVWLHDFEDCWSGRMSRLDDYLAKRKGE